MAKILNSILNLEKKNKQTNTAEMILRFVMKKNTTRRIPCWHIRGSWVLGWSTKDFLSEEFGLDS
jgi:hypothetical protein